MNLSYLLRLFLPLFLVGAAAPSNSVHSASPFPTPGLIQRPTFTYVSGGVTPSIPDGAREAEAGYGFEGGRVVREGGAAYLFTAEFKGWPINANMRIGKLVLPFKPSGETPKRARAGGATGSMFSVISVHSPSAPPLNRKRWHTYLFLLFHKTTQ